MRDAPREFLRILRAYDPDLDCRWNVNEHVWVVWRRSRGAWHEECVLGSDDPGAWVVDYLQERDVTRKFRRGWRDYRTWLRDRAAAREARMLRERRQRAHDAIQDNRRLALPRLRDDVAWRPGVVVHGLKGRREG